jgi:hypothetical protein
MGMTLPEEQDMAVLNTREFLLKLMYPPSDGGYLKVPKKVKEMAKHLLRHYPDIQADRRPVPKGLPLRMLEDRFEPLPQNS